MKASLWIAEQEKQGRDWRAELKRKRRKERAAEKPTPLPQPTHAADIEAVGSPEVLDRLVICKACEQWTGASCGEYQCSAKWRNDLRRGKCPEDRFV